MNEWISTIILDKNTFKIYKNNNLKFFIMKKKGKHKIYYLNEKDAYENSRKYCKFFYQDILNMYSNIELMNYNPIINNYKNNLYYFDGCIVNGKDI